MIYRFGFLIMILSRYAKFQIHLIVGLKNSFY